MTPPAEIAEEHARTVERGKATYAAIESLLIELEAVTGLSGLIALFDGPVMVVLSEAGDQFSAFCADLDAVADSAGIEIELHCG